VGDLRITEQTKTVLTDSSETNELGDRTPPGTTPPEESTNPWLTTFNDNTDEAAYLLINGGTFGLGGWALDSLGFTNNVDKNSSFFQWGERIDTAVGLATLRPLKLLKGCWQGLVGIGKGCQKLAVSVKKVAEIGPAATIGKVAAKAKNFAKATLGVASRLDYRRTFFEAYPHLKGNVVVHHAVEQRILSEYPHLISELEMHSLENLRGIPKELNAELHLKKMALLDSVC
jgi:hypothetical protein